MSHDLVRRAGEVVTFTFGLTNTGDVVLNSVEIEDELPGLGPTSCDRPTPITLAPKATTTCSATLVVTQDLMDFGAIYNVARVSAEGPGGDVDDPTDDVVAVADTYVAVLQAPKLRLTPVSVAGQPIGLGETLAFSWITENTGNVTLTKVSLTSGLARLGRMTCDGSTATPLVPGGRRTCSAPYVVRNADLRRGAIVARATARGLAPYAGEDSGRVSDVVTTRVRVAADTDATDGADGPSEEPLADTGGTVLAVPMAGAGLFAIGARLLRRRT